MLLVFSYSSLVTRHCSSVTRHLSLVTGLGHCPHTRRRLGGLHPLCGMGVTSLIFRTSNPAVASARMADSRPAPGPFTRTSTLRIPWSRAALATRIAACCAAKGVPLRDPLKPSEPALDQQITRPSESVMATCVLLNVASTCTIPVGTMRFSFFLKTFFLPAFAAAFA